MNRRKRSLPGRGLWLLAGIAAGAAAAMGLCGIPGKRKVRRRLMRAADAVNDAIDNMLGTMR